MEHLGKGADSRSRLMAVLPTREDRTALQRIIGPSKGELQWMCTCEEAIDAFRRTSPPIVICDRDLPDGDWRQLWDILARGPKPPMFIVTPRLADDALWGGGAQRRRIRSVAETILRRRSDPDGAWCCDTNPAS